MELILALVLFALMIGVWAFMPSGDSLVAEHAPAAMVEPTVGQLSTA
ncbi:MAG TPA: hypothetical protein VD886_03950 [Herpetosiphonaceae bacterium]|nr:hypothetical protein [Herpetosiphonaceae bacterium]